MPYVRYVRSVRKSSVYLPEELKERLAAVAARSGRSEAELMRAAVERLVHGATPVAPADLPPLPWPRPSVQVVGMGPGDPELVTLRARATLVGADRAVVLTTGARAVGRAEMVVRALAPAIRIVRVPFEIGGDAEARDRSLATVVDAVLAGTDAGELVAVPVLGDPTQWTVHRGLAEALRIERPTVPVAAVVGISAYQSAAAAAGVTLGANGEPLVVVDAVDDLDAYLERPDATVVLLKASTDAEALQAVARRHGRSGLLTELTGLPGEHTVPLAELPPGPISYLATVVFPSTTRAAAVAR